MRWDEACKQSPYRMAMRQRGKKGVSVITSASDYFIEVERMTGAGFEKCVWKGRVERIKIRFDDWQPVTDAIIGDNYLIRKLASLVNKDVKIAKPAVGEDRPKSLSDAKQGPSERPMGLAALLKEANEKLSGLNEAIEPLDSMNLSSDDLVKCLDNIITKATALRNML